MDLRATVTAALILMSTQMAAPAAAQSAPPPRQGWDEFDYEKCVEARDVPGQEASAKRFENSCEWDISITYCFLSWANLPSTELACLQQKHAEALVPAHGGFTVRAAGHEKRLIAYWAFCVRTSETPRATAVWQGFNDAYEVEFDCT